MGDPNGGPCYNRYDRIREDFLWKDRVQKEAGARPSDGPKQCFQMNLVSCSANGSGNSKTLWTQMADRDKNPRVKHSHQRLESVTEKEHKQSPRSRMSLKGMDPTSLEVLAISHNARRPTDKWDMAMTSAQDHGWLLGNPVRSSTLCKSVPSLTAQQSQSSTSLPSPSHLAGIRGSGNGFMPVPPPKAMTMTTPANIRVLDRVKSEPNLPCGPSHPELKQLNMRRWHRPKGTSDVTSYVNVYQTINGHSPFSSHARN